VAISDRIRAEARRTIDGMQKFYEKYGDDIDDSEELEHRIARVEASMEGCNGLTQDEKVQKTAENLFELTCSQERTYDALRREMRLARDEYKRECDEIKKNNARDFEALRQDLRTGLKNIKTTIESSGCDNSSNSSNPKSRSNNQKAFSKFISEHPVIAFNAFIFVILLVFISGHFEFLEKICGVAK
jgi:hypothetical protein